MEAGQAGASPHGSATYRLHLSLPDPVSSYTLELPEIYSSYRLYVNGRQVASCGIPEPENYKPSIHSGAVTFEASGNTTLLLAVSDWSYLYSGFVYPPAFGNPVNVNSLLEQKFAWELSVSLLALLLGLSQAILFILLKSHNALYSSMIAIPFAISVCSPALHRLTATGIVPFYNIELFCRYAVYGAAVLLVNHLYGKRSKARTAVSITAVLFPFAALGVSLAAPALSYQTMNLFSQLTGIYKICCSLWILCTSFFAGIGETTIKNRLLLAGTCVFASALAADRLMPAFEPLRFGWFSETAGLIFVLIVSFLVFQDSFRIYRERIQLSQEKIWLESQICLQKKHYAELSDQMDGIRTMRHDTRHHFTQLSLLLKEGGYQEAENYLNQISQEALKTTPLTFCENYAADVLLRYYYTLAEDKKIPFSIQVRLPEQTGISDGDLSVVLGNILENGVEASLRLPQSQRFLTLNMTKHSSNLYIESSNAFTGELTVTDGVYGSLKKKGRTGIGLSSIRTTAEKYEGEVWVDTTLDGRGHVFTIRVVLILPKDYF
ncbi:GHKL domain-containing protein [Clostridium sp. AM58-1XD]|uniref:sensor histidine kinase n=1 Tax=Clostridium sp. AM58-1XD TaxID=2292307 RepID=UPI001FA91AC5|nr:GHKL domain-containing protein [Clostridium sp. AM58-1XD]